MGSLNLLEHVLGRLCLVLPAEGEGDIEVWVFGAQHSSGMAGDCITGENLTGGGGGGDAALWSQ